MKLVLILLSFLMVSCATNSVVTEYDLDAAYRHRHYGYLIPHMEKRALEAKELDKLLKLLDLAVVYQNSGEYKKSHETFLKAKKYVQWNDYISLSEETTSLLMSENYKKYKIEDHEQLLIHAYEMFNFMFLQNTESALVEARALDQSLYRLSRENEFFKKDENFYGSYLSGIMYEQNKQYDEAYIDYKRVYNSNPKFAYIGYDLYRTAYYAKNFADAQKWAKTFGISKEYQDLIISGEYKKLSEVVVIYQNGSAPHKVPHPGWAGVAAFQPRINGAEDAAIEISGVDRGQTIPLFNIEALAIDIAASRHKKMLARDVARKVAKEALMLPLDVATGFVGGAIARVAIHSTASPD